MSYKTSELFQKIFRANAPNIKIKFLAFNKNFCRGLRPSNPYQLEAPTCNFILIPDFLIFFVLPPWSFCLATNLTRHRSGLHKYLVIFFHNLLYVILVTQSDYPLRIFKSFFCSVITKPFMQGTELQIMDREKITYWRNNWVIKNNVFFQLP